MLVKLLSVNLAHSCVDMSLLYEGLCLLIPQYTPSIHPRYGRSSLVDVLVDEKDLESAHLAFISGLEEEQYEDYIFTLSVSSYIN